MIDWKWNNPIYPIMPKKINPWNTSSRPTRMSSSMSRTSWTSWLSMQLMLTQLSSISLRELTLANTGAATPSCWWGTCWSGRGPSATRTTSGSRPSTWWRRTSTQTTCRDLRTSCPWNWHGYVQCDETGYYSNIHLYVLTCAFGDLLVCH